MIILGTFKLKHLTTEEVSLPESFDPKLTSFLIQIRARLYVYSIHPSTYRWWKLFLLGSTTKLAFLSMHGGLLESTRTVPLKSNSCIYCSNIYLRTFSHWDHPVYRSFLILNTTTHYVISNIYFIVLRFQKWESRHKELSLRKHSDLLISIYLSN